MLINRKADCTHWTHALILPLVLFLTACSAGGSGEGVADLRWVVPVEREDGTGLSPSEIAGFRIYYSTESGHYSNAVVIDDHTATQAMLDDVLSGTYFVVMTTVDTEGRESVFSAPEIEVTF